MKNNSICMRKLIFYFLLGVVIISCGESSKNEPKSEESKSEISEDTVKTEIKKNIPEGFMPFENIEQIHYTIYLPQTFYKHNHDSCAIRAQHYFYSENNPDDYFEVKGLFRSDEAIDIEEYFNQTYTEDDEAEGKIIEEKKIFVTDSVFYAVGYWSNFPERKFLEITWMRKDDVVQLYVNDFLADHQPFWNTKIEFLVSKGLQF
jgi:hypothetical protein